MAITTKPLRVPAKLFSADQELVGFLQGVVDRIEKPRIAAVDDLNQTIGGTYSQAQVQALSDKVDELLAAIRTARILEDT